MIGIYQSKLLNGGTSNPGREHGFVVNGSYSRFDFPGSAFTDGSAINDGGLIVGGYSDSGGTRHGYTARAQAGLNRGGATQKFYNEITLRKVAAAPQWICFCAAETDGTWGRLRAARGLNGVERSGEIERVFSAIES
jgi:hypothetical protein